MITCVHCGERPAGFWVYAHDAKVVRRPWCLICLAWAPESVRAVPMQQMRP